MTGPETLRDYAPTGTLRVALNHGNRLLVGRDDAGEAFGIAVDLARALAQELGLPIRFVQYERAADVSASATGEEWDICFLAVDPERSGALDFTDPYLAIDGCYLAGPECDAADAAALVASGAPVGTVIGSAYTLTLERLPGASTLVRFAGMRDALAALDARTVAAVAGIGPVLRAEAGKRPGARLLEPPFMEIRQAMAIAKGRPAAAEHLRVFMARMVRSGAIVDILERHGLPRTSAIVAT